MTENINLKELNIREGDPGDFITHNIENCTGCGSCIIICPANLWKLEKGKSILAKDYKERCMECVACESVCDYNAITFTYPKGGTGIKYMHG
ncbi:MAG: 4Fe-4S binding protein [Candidatus Helarchaeota archaeon]|nr:4Fe-4S binding protein [Candidatus Helarchaeota archaeon]